MSSPQTTTDLAAVVDAIRSHDRFLVTTHENPDGDALGSLLAAKLGLDALGKDSVMYLAGETPLPREYAWMPFGNLRRAVPEDAAGRVLLALDCANESRLGPDPEILASAPLVVNVDHHHDNSRFGAVNLVVADASSTGEIVRDLLAELDVELTPDIAEAIYIALVTDTGRFQYTNTTPKALRLAAELVEAGADVHKIFQDVYESVQFAKLKLLARALERAQIYEGGRLVVSYLLRDDFSRSGRRSPTSRGSSTTSAPSRAPTWPRSFASLRVATGRRGGSACAHRRTRSTCRGSPAPPAAEDTGRQPAFPATIRSKTSPSSSDASSPRREMARKGAATPSGLVLFDKPAGPSSFAIVRDVREKTGARAGHAGTLDPFATASCSSCSARSRSRRSASWAFPSGTRLRSTCPG